MAAGTTLILRASVRNILLKKITINDTSNYILCIFVNQKIKDIKKIEEPKRKSPCGRKKYTDSSKYKLQVNAYSEAWKIEKLGGKVAVREFLIAKIDEEIARLG